MKSKMLSITWWFIIVSIFVTIIFVLLLVSYIHDPRSAMRDKVETTNHGGTTIDASMDIIGNRPYKAQERINFTLKNNNFDSNRLKQLPLMLINAGMRSSGTSEFRLFFRNELKNFTKCIKYACDEAHFWNNLYCITKTTTTTTTKKMKIRSNITSNSTIDNQIDIEKTKTERAPTTTTRTTMIIMNDYNENKQCNVIGYIKKFDNQRYNPSYFNHGRLFDKNTLYYEKTPNYYLYPHIGYLFSKHVLFEKTKIFLLIRDPIKCILSMYYDTEGKEFYKKYSKNKNIQSNYNYQLYYKQHLLNNSYFNYIKDDILAKYIAITNMDVLMNVYNRISNLYLNYVYLYKNGSKFEDLKHGNSIAFRYCPIVPLISWFKYFNIFEQLSSDSITKDANTNTDTDRMDEKQRFMLVQSEYYFNNLEDITNRLRCWAMGYNPWKNCTFWDKGGNNKKQGRYSRYINDKKEYKWVKFDYTLKQNKQIAHAHDSQYKQAVNISNYFQKYLSKWLQPCTIHTVYLLQMIKNKSSFVMFDNYFDPNLWSLAISS